MVVGADVAAAAAIEGLLSAAGESGVALCAPSPAPARPIPHGPGAAATGGGVQLPSRRRYRDISSCRGPSREASA